MNSTAFLLRLPRTSLNRPLGYPSFGSQFNQSFQTSTTYLKHTSRIRRASTHFRHITKMHMSTSVPEKYDLNFQPVDNFKYISEKDTIFALSSGAGVKAGVAIIRISGPSAIKCLKKLIQSPTSEVEVKLPKPRYASVRKLYHPISHDLLDQGLVLFFPQPKSFTGEDVVELHVHGSRAVINGIIDALEQIHTSFHNNDVIRPSERGEFTRRAFENGRMDLTAVEGLADLISAETSMQRQQALRQLSGEVRNMLENWREEIKSCLAHAEAVIDFGDDVDEQAFEDILPRVETLNKEIISHLNDKKRGEIVRNGARVVIVGEPNAGKSTLLNILAKRPAAIVSPHEGTTRDIVEVQLDLNGLPVLLSDTAGLREKTTDPIEIEGMRRAMLAASDADVLVLVHDAANGGADAGLRSLSKLTKEIAENGQSSVGANSKLICILNKIDLHPINSMEKLDKELAMFQTCLIENTGVNEFVNYLEEVIRKQIEGDDDNLANETKPLSDSPAVITRARHRYHLSNASEALSSFLSGRTGVDRSLYLPMDLAAEELRIAGKELGAITGIIDCEEILDVIFSEFCIGK